MSLTDAESASESAVATTKLQKSGCRAVKIAGMTFVGVGVTIAAAMVGSHAFTKPRGASIDQQHSDLNDWRVHDGMILRLQQKFEAPDRALDDSVDGKGTNSATPPTSAPTPAATSAPATAAKTLDVVTGAIHWATHPEYCFDIAGGRQESGTNLQVWHCNASHKDNREFTMPMSGEGPIHWSLHPEDCVDIAGGKANNGNNVQMWLNDCSHDNMQFIMPSGGVGPLRWAVHPEKCVDIDGGKTGDATNIKLWDCEDNGEHPNQQFMLPLAPA